jgi:hypothetical protein
MYTLKSNVGFNVRAMYGLAKHGHTLDFLDQCTDFQSRHVYMKEMPIYEQCMDWQNIAIHWISWTNVRTNVQLSNQAMFTWLDWKKCQSKKQCKSGKAMINA